VGAQYVEDYDFLPSGAVVLFRETANSLVILSLGYSVRAPSLYELYLPFKKSFLYGGDQASYADRGNSSLKREKQLVASAIIEIGSLDNSIGLSITSGSITDGIDWRRQPEADSTGTYILFSPINGDVTFVNVTLQPRIMLKDFLSFTAGGAYHYLDYAAFENKPYSPEYQFFTGLELHVFWSQKLVDLFAYGEIVYTGPYDGYDQTGLGKEPVANAKLSLALKDFRFHLVFQNVLGNDYNMREGISFPGRYFYYGLTWNFLN
jgi:hypothetical protein